MDEEYEARRAEFGEQYDDYEADDLAALIVYTGERLEALCLDEDAVDLAMKTLHRALGLPEFSNLHEGDRSWRALWEETDTGNLETLPLAQRLTSINAYARFGLPPTGDGKPCSIEDVKDVIKTVKAAIAPDVIDSPKIEEIDKTLMIAQGRLSLDEGRGVSPEQLAELARMSIKSVRNALSPSGSSGLKLKDGLITAASALQWLKSREYFRSSIWQNAEMNVQENIQPAAIVGEILWVPFASDETEFHPETCKRAGQYIIGPKGAERHFSDYREALDSLARMLPVPYWRRPNVAGNWGIVTAAGFHPRKPEDLGIPPLNKELGE